MQPDLWCYNTEFLLDEIEPPSSSQDKEQGDELEVQAGHDGDENEEDGLDDTDLDGQGDEDSKYTDDEEYEEVGLTLGQAGQQVAVQEYDLAELIAMARSESFQPAVIPVNVVDITHITDRELLWHFDSWWDFVDTAEHGHSSVKYESRRSHRLDTYNEIGTRTWQEAVDLARTGWPEGLRQAQPIFEIVHELIPTRRRRQATDMAMVGPGRIDMVAYMTHQPEPWAIIRDLEPIDNIGSVISVVANVAALGFVSAGEMYLKGAVLAGMIDLLESMGKRVELTLLMSSFALYGSGKCTFEIMVKRAEDALNQELLIFALANPACFRRLGFSLREQLPQEWLAKMSVPNGYGRTDEKPPIYPGAICIGGNGLNISTGDIVPWLKRTLASQGIEWEGD